MIRLRRTSEDGKEVVMLGLSDENLARLQDDSPILVKQDDELRLGADLVIFHGKTEMEMVEQLEKTGVLPEGSHEKAAQIMEEGGGYVKTPDS